MPSPAQSTVPADPLTPAVPAARAFPNLQRTLVEAPRWLLLLALVFGPWAYGATRPWAVHWLGGLLILAVTLWGCECIARRRWPAVPWMVAGAAGALLLQGWCMAINAHSSFEAQTGMLLPTAAPAPGWPGSASGPHSREAMCWMTGLLGAFLFSCDLASRRIWRHRIWTTMALVGASIAAFGIVQKIGGEQVLAWIWEPEKRDLTNNFATFRNRNNAGAFLNLVLPLVAALGVLACRDKGHGRKAGWTAALFLVAAGVQLNPSRAGWGIAVLMAVVFGFRLIWQWWRHRRDELPFKQLLLGGLVAALLAGGLAGITLLGRWESSWRRFNVLGVDPSQRIPTEIYLKMMRDAGPFGFGPGTFEAAFPGYQRQHDFGSRAVPASWTHHFWPHAHQDYMQTVMEWGGLGAALWGLLVFGGLARGLRRHAGAPRDASLHWLQFGGVLALAATLLHSMVDFPLQIPSIQLYFCVLLALCWGGNGPGVRGPVPG